MRRAFLLIAAIAIPVLVWAAASAPSGGFIEVDQYVAPLSYINAAQCAGTSSLNVEWNNTSSVTAGGSYNIYASSAAPTTTGTNSGFCAEMDDPNASGGSIKAGLVKSYPATSQVQQASDLPGATAVAEAGQSCTENAILYLCAHYYVNATKTSSAWGKFVVQVTAPLAPTGVGVNPGDSKLEVTWTANGSTPVLTDHYVARAFQVGGTTPVATATADGAAKSATIKGLANGTTYEVDVVAYSVAGNPSPASSPRLSAAPVPTADFWTVYRSDGGQEQGGCGAGAGGALSLLGLAALAALRRRKP